MTPEQIIDYIRSRRDYHSGQADKCEAVSAHEMQSRNLSVVQELNNIILTIEKGRIPEMEKVK